MKKVFAVFAVLVICVMAAAGALAADSTLAVGQSVSLSGLLPTGVMFISASSSNTASVIISGSSAYGIAAGSAVVSTDYGIYDTTTGALIYAGTSTLSVDVTGGGGGGGGGGGSNSYTVTLKAGENTTAATGFSWISGFSSTNSSVAEAYQDGNALKVRAHNQGTCTLSCSAFKEGESNATNITVYATVSSSSTTYQESLTLYVGENRYASRRFNRLNTLFSSNPTVAGTMDNGGRINVYGYAAGFSTITAEAADFDGSTVSVILNVTVMTTSGSVVSGSDYVENILLPVGKTGYVEAPFTNVSGITSSNPAVATARYSAGRIWVTGRSDGKATITAAAASGITPTLIKLNVTVGTGSAGSSAGTITDSVFVDVGKAGYTTAPITSVYSVSVANPYICEATATTNGVKVTGLSVGRTTVSAAGYDSDGKLAALKVFVTVSAAKDSRQSQPSQSSARQSSAAASNVRVEAGSTKLVETKYSAIKSLRSEDKSVATVKIESGRIRITGVSAGETAITFQAKASSSSPYKTYTFDVTVTGGASAVYASEAEYYDEGDGTGLTIRAGEPISAKKNTTSAFPAVYVNGRRTAASKLIFSTSDSDVVTVSRRGKYSTYKAGTAEITVSTRDGRYSESFEIEVR